MLLEERFKLSLRRETRELPIYELIATKGRSKLGQPTDRDCLAPQSKCHSFQGGSGYGIDGGYRRGHLSLRIHVDLSDRNVI